MVSVLKDEICCIEIIEKILNDIGYIVNPEIDFIGKRIYLRKSQVTSNLRNDGRS